MTSNNLQKAPLAAMVSASVLQSQAAEKPSLDSLTAKIKDKDDNVRTEGWQRAAALGVPAIKPLAALLADDAMEVARAAKRALWKIVRSAGAPAAGQEKKATVAELLSLLNGQGTAMRREVLWMLSEIGGDESVEPVSVFLADKETQEAAVAALQRIPGRKSISALRTALEKAPEDFKPRLAQALRHKGAKVTGFPSQNLVPTKSTSLKAAV